VAIHCKLIEPSIYYRVEVRDENWTGLWCVEKSQMAQAIDDTNIPSC
jgi:hypothetical protein